MARNWDDFYSSPAYTDQFPDALLVDLAGCLTPGRALDLACGAGRHAIHLSRLGWQVTAVDNSPAAIDRLHRAAPRVDVRLADLESGYIIEPAAFDLICDFYYLQRNLFPAIREGVRPGGVFAGVIHLLEAGHSPAFSLASGELRNEFAGWKILYYSEGGEPGRARRSSRIIARRA